MPALFRGRHFFSPPHVLLFKNSYGAKERLAEMGCFRNMTAEKGAMLQSRTDFGDENCCGVSKKLLSQEDLQ